MSSANLTTRDVARLLRVSEATVKRWADTGVLGSEKTVGGHRRFSLQAVARLRRELRIDPGTQGPPGKNARDEIDTSPPPSTASFTESLLRGDEQEVAAVLVNAYLHAHPLASLFDTTITEAMHQVGELWSKGTITVADEHLATRVLLNGLQKLSSIVLPAESTGLKAICCGIEGDLHEVPIYLAAMILETQGWQVKNLGPDTPLFALRDMVARQRPQLVCISARTIADLDRATNEYAQLRKTARKVAAAVIIGGEGLREATLRARFPAEFYAVDFAGLSKFVRMVAKKKG